VLSRNWFLPHKYSATSTKGAKERELYLWLKQWLTLIPKSRDAILNWGTFPNMQGAAFSTPTPLSFDHGMAYVNLANGNSTEKDRI
jgi:hypothetical protein